METLAYTHLATANESSENIVLTAIPCPNWKKLVPSSAWIRLGAIAISLALVGIVSSSALALQRGNQGSQVTGLQQQLRVAGFYNGPITGFYGELTQAAVRRFQQARGLAVDGIAGSNTLAALNGMSSGGSGGGSSLPTGVLLKRGSRGTTVTQLQKTLAAKGFFSGPATGYYGSLTEAAVRRFQQTRGLLADGVAGPSTIAALKGTSSDGSGFPTGTLRPGNSGAAVTQLQNRLRGLGFYNGPITGFYSRLTEEAIADFQSSREMNVTGIADPTTLAALQKSSTGNPTTRILQRGSRGADVTQLQNQLKSLGFFNGPVTGYYGELTETAVRNFQRSRKVAVNGMVGPTTWAVLQDSFIG